MTEIEKAEGLVEVRLVGPDGVSRHLDTIHNTTTYASADAAAAAYAGDFSMIPRSIAFLYGQDSTGSLGTLTRDMTWADVSSSYSHTDPDVPFSYAPSVEASDGNYSGNKVVFHGRTEGISEYSGVSSYVYGACLLGKSKDGSYRLLAIVDLGAKQKPDDYELSVDWAVKFK